MILALVDRPVPVVDRTPRELAILGIGLFGTAYGFIDHDLYRWEWMLSFALATALFAVRFWPARSVALGTCLGALAQCACVRTWDDWPPVTLAAVLAIVLLASRDLTERFDEAPSRVSWFPNAWSELPRAHARTLRLCAYSLAITGTVVFQEWCLGARGFPWSPPLVGVLAATVVLLARGKAVALFLVFGIAVAIGIGVAPVALGLEPSILPSWQPLEALPDPRIAGWMALVLAGVSAGLSVPYLVRLVARAMRD
jgi:hypothetical protein